MERDDSLNGSYETHFPTIYISYLIVGKTSEELSGLKSCCRRVNHVLKSSNRGIYFTLGPDYDRHESVVAENIIDKFAR